MMMEQNCLAIVWLIEKFSPYFYSSHFPTATDHHAIFWLSSMKNMSRRVWRWVLRLLEVDFFSLQSTKCHHDAGVLSRCPFFSLDNTSSASHSGNSNIPPASRHLWITFLEQF